MSNGNYHPGHTLGAPLPAARRIATGKGDYVDQMAAIAAEIPARALPAIGATLRNGATVLEIRDHQFGGVVILAKEGHGGGQYVTWRAGCDHGGDDTTWGHYTPDLVEAARDFLER